MEPRRTAAPFLVLALALLPLLAAAAPVLDACRARAGGAHSVAGLGGQDACICAANHQCVFPGADGFRFPCAHGTLTIGDITHDLVPVHCADCVCQQGTPSVPRVLLPSVPRSGNSWFRELLELSTGIATETVWAETFSYHVPEDLTKKVTMSATYNDATGLWGSECGIIHACSRVSTTKGKVVVAKTHAPFLPLKDITLRLSGERYNRTDVGIGSYLLLPIRNPLDNWNAWMRYREKKTRMTAEVEREFAVYLRRWAQHHVYWLSSITHADVPRFVFRFEDLGQDSLRPLVLSNALHRSGLWHILGLTDADVRTAVDDPRVQPFAVGDDNHVSVASLAEGYRIYKYEDIKLAMDSVPNILKAFGYYELYSLWLEALDEGLAHEEVLVRTSEIIETSAQHLYQKSF